MSQAGGEMRSFWKGPAYVHFAKHAVSDMKIAARHAVIFPAFIGKTFLVKRGDAQLRQVTVTSEMIGFKFGEFVFTKKRGEAKK